MLYSVGYSNPSNRRNLSFADGKFRTTVPAQRWAPPMGEILNQLITAPGHDLRGVLLKLELADEFEEFTKPEMHGEREVAPKLIVSALADLRRLAAHA